MSTFTEDFQRRLRAVLAKRTRDVIPPDAEVLIAPSAAGSDDDSRGLDTALTIETSTWSHRYSYDEPGAWPRLLADLEAVDEPGPLTALETDLLEDLNDRGGAVIDQPDLADARDVLASRDLIQRHGEHWYITPQGRGVVAGILGAAGAEGRKRGLRLVRPNDSEAE